MSQGARIPLAEAEAIATELVGLLAPACDRIEVAGSIRRRRPEVGDIELVAIPATVTVASDGLWGDVDEIAVDALERRIAELAGAGVLSARVVEVHRRDGSVEHQQRMGGRYRALLYRDTAIDLFTATRDNWGLMFALRTGPGDWNQKIVTDCQRFFRRVEGGQVLHLGRPVPCPEERDFFREVGQPWVEPAERALARVAIRAPR